MGKFTRKGDCLRGPEFDAALRKFDRDGLTRAEIGRRLGVSGSVVAGRLHRLGLCDPARSPIKRRAANPAPVAVTRPPLPPGDPITWGAISKQPFTRMECSL